MFHYEGFGSVYPFAFETLTAVMRMAARPAKPEAVAYSVKFFGPHINSLLRTLAWAETNEINTGGVTGWRSNCRARRYPPSLGHRDGPLVLQGP